MLLLYEFQRISGALKIWGCLSRGPELSFYEGRRILTRGRIGLYRKRVVLGYESNNMNF